MVDAKAVNFQISPVALKHLGTLIPTSGPTHQTNFGPSHHDEGTKTEEMDKEMSVLSTLWSFGDCADNAQNVNTILSPRPSLRPP